MKKKNGWTQRQLKRQKTIPRTKTHWDLLMDEMVHDYMIVFKETKFVLEMDEN